MYTHVVLGGTFDHFHAGHKHLIITALSLGGKVTIGLTAPDFVHIKQFAETIQPYDVREAEIISFVQKHGRENDIQIIKIHDVFGTTLIDNTLEAIVVTEHTRIGAENINTERKKRGLPELTIHVCPFVRDDEGQILSSTRVRAGSVNRRGFVYASLFVEDVTISEKLAIRLREPLGDERAALVSFEEKSPTIYIGDVVTQSAIKANEPFTCAYVDRMSHRKPYTFAIPLPYHEKKTDLNNPHGHIARDAARHMEKNIFQAHNDVFIITGEEDLLALPAILLSPLGSHVVYGQPFGKEGLVDVFVTEEKKEHIRSLISNM